MTDYVSVRDIYFDKALAILCRHDYVIACIYWTLIFNSSSYTH